MYKSHDFGVYQIGMKDQTDSNQPKKKGSKNGLTMTGFLGITSFIT